MSSHVQPASRLRLLLQLDTQLLSRATFVAWATAALEGAQGSGHPMPIMLAVMVRTSWNSSQMR